jgi:cobalamin biosynthesis Co2+ chelatase CbiK
MSDPHIQTSIIITGKEYTEMQAKIARLKAEVERLRSASQPIIRVIEDRRAHGGKYVDKPASVIMLEAKLLLDLEAALTPSQEPRT